MSTEKRLKKLLSETLVPGEEIEVFANPIVKGRMAGVILKRSSGIIGRIIAKFIDRGKSGPDTVWIIVTTARVFVFEAYLSIGPGLGNLLWESPRADISASLKSGFFHTVTLMTTSQNDPLVTLVFGYALKTRAKRLASALPTSPVAPVG